MQNLKNKLAEVFNVKVTEKGSGLKFNVRELNSKNFDYLSTVSNEHHDINVRRSGTGLVVFISKSN